MLLANKKGGMTYAQFSKWVTDRYPIRNWTSNINNAGLRTGGLPAAGSSGRTMVGTPWGSYCGSNSGFDYAFMHCCPTLAIKNEIIASKRHFVLTPRNSGLSQSVAGITRNGQQSYAGTANPAFYIDEFIYWDESLKMAMTLNPFLMSAPVPFIPS
jgi:hypothetical protein